MKKRIEKSAYKTFNILEVFIAVLIILTILIFSFNLLKSIVEMVSMELTDELLMSFIERALNLVIGIEFVKMLCNHKLATVIEVLLFAIARQMIVEHLAVWETFLGVLSIAILFGIRKYLFIREDKE